MQNIDARSLRTPPSFFLLNITWPLGTRLGSNGCHGGGGCHGVDSYRDFSSVMKKSV